MTPHHHDMRYFTVTELTAGQVDVTTGAVRMTFGQQRRWLVPGDFAVVLPSCTILDGAELVLNDGAELCLVG